jgi:hypothetical protein
MRNPGRQGRSLVLLQSALSQICKRFGSCAPSGEEMPMEDQRDIPPLRFFEKLSEGDGVSTLERLFKSRHVADLKFIFLVSCVLTLVGSSFVVWWHGWIDKSGVIGPAALISAIVGTGCYIIAWTYQTGSARLGIVDLFSCEIGTICKVTTVTETALHYARMYENPPCQTIIPFSSQEQYSPIFESNSNELKVLEARVVEHVTEFYTYFKAMRDYLRLVHEIDKPQQEIERWRTLLRNGIYTLFLMLESARKSICVLVECEAQQAESTIVILISELVAYGLLLKYYEGQTSELSRYDARLERLRLRKKEYHVIVCAIYRRTSSLKDYNGRDKQTWQRAAALLPELNQRYHDALGKRIECEFPPSALPKSVSGDEFVSSKEIDDARQL